MAELNTKFLTKTVIPRVLKAAIWGTLTLIIVYYVPMMLIPRNLPQNIIPFDFNTFLFNFAMISIFFAVAGQLFSGTIYGCCFGVAKAIIIISYFFAISEGGILGVSLPVSGTIMNITVDICIILLMVVSVSLLSIAKHLLEAVTILSEKPAELDFT